ncbi:MAG: hypothetical protein MUP27_09160 [Desulfobacterales bacterium]|nr:hypothetical protein [Desulfobacterales bacterium]
MKKTLFWKSVGGYIYCVKLGRRWHYVGSTGMEGIEFHSVMKGKGFQLERVQGTPKALADIWNAKGSTVKVLRESLPFWKDYFEKKVQEPRYVKWCLGHDSWITVSASQTTCPKCGGKFA